MYTEKLRPLAGQTHLLPGMAQRKQRHNRAYLMELKPENLLLAHYLEAGLAGRMDYKPEGIHWGWDSPLSEIRGTVCGHWLSAAAHHVAQTGDPEMEGRCRFIVGEIARCQAANGGQWAFPIPEKYVYWLREGRNPWAPLYVCHKNMTGLLDQYRLLGNQQALEINRRSAEWFWTFTEETSRTQLDDMMDLEETGGMMEYFADLYAVTGEARHLELMRRFERPRLAKPLLEGVDVLTNMHANATIPEVLGYARAYEVTGEEDYRRVVESYWRLAVEERDAFATGGQTSGEIWTPKGKLAARLGDKNQEHCVVYNMMRLAEYLLRWTGESRFADYRELNLYNGLYAQGYWQDPKIPITGGSSYPEVTTVAYYQPMAPGSTKYWGSRTGDFFCCHNTLLQANATHHQGIYYQTEEGVYVAQSQESEVAFEIGGVPVALRQTRNAQTGGEMMRDHPVNRQVESRPHSLSMILDLKADRLVAFTLYVRLPAWMPQGQAMRILVDGEPVDYAQTPDGYAAVTRTFQEHRIEVFFPKELRCVSLPDDPGMAAFLDGPVCLAGLVSEEHLLYGDMEHPEYTLLCPDDERQWQNWKTGWKTYRQPFGIRFRPLYEIGHEPYTIYFPIEEGKE